MNLTVNCIQENTPGIKWQALFNKAWPYYRQWFLSEGVQNRKGYLSSYSMLEHHMPELLPIYNQLTALAGGGDLEARFLSMYCPPPYLAGCSQMACHLDKVFLIRNYDYNPTLFEGNLLYTNWLKPVIGMSDCTWGLLDGMNGDGLAVSLAFGGRKESGEGFGIPLLVRYILETATTVAEAVLILKRIPVHMVYNVTLADATGNVATVFVSPDKAPVISEKPLATNHQEQVEWQQYADLTSTLERKAVLETMYENSLLKEDDLVNKFLQAPLYNYNYDKNFGTLYCINYRVTERNIRMYWPEQMLIEKSFEHFVEEAVTVYLPLPKQVLPII